MYMTIKHPNELHTVEKITGGLWVIPKANETILIIKASKEIILTARERKKFRFYLHQSRINRQVGTTLITAFFDDHDSPLTIATPVLSEEKLTHYLSNLPDTFSACFFDEHNREFLSCRARSKLEKLRACLTTSSHLASCHAREMIDRAEHWFARRTHRDDSASFTVDLFEELFPSDFQIYDLRPHGFHGADDKNFIRLERPEPGPSQELDIVHLLLRSFSPNQILHSPLNISDNKELVDILVLGKTANILISAKDSPNTLAQLDNTIDRKISKSVSKLREGLGQLEGAVKTIRRENPKELKFADGNRVEIDLSNRQLICLAIVKELFTHKYEEYSSLALAFMEKNRIPTIFLDYSELQIFTRYCDTEEKLLDALHQIFIQARDTGNYPRLRFNGPPPS